MYKHILFATDLAKETDYLIQKVLAMQKLTGSKLTIIHVVEPFYPYNYMMYGVEDLERQLLIESKKELQKIAKNMNIDPSNQIIEIGSTKTIILEKAKELGIDLIMCGNHGKHGLARLLGSTANAILSRAECDVLMIPFPN